MNWRLDETAGEWQRTGQRTAVMRDGVKNGMAECLLNSDIGFCYVAT